MSKAWLDFHEQPVDCPYCGKKVEYKMLKRFREYKNGGGTWEYAFECNCEDADSHEHFGRRKRWKPYWYLHKDLCDSEIFDSLEEGFQFYKWRAIKYWNRYAEEWAKRQEPPKGKKKLLEELIVDMWHELNYESVRADDGENGCLERVAQFDERMKELDILLLD